MSAVIGLGLLLAGCDAGQQRLGAGAAVLTMVSSGDGITADGSTAGVDARDLCRSTEVPDEGTYGLVTGESASVRVEIPLDATVGDCSVGSFRAAIRFRTPWDPDGDILGNDYAVSAALYQPDGDQACWWDSDPSEAADLSTTDGSSASWAREELRWHCDCGVEGDPPTALRLTWLFTAKCAP